MSIVFQSFKRESAYSNTFEFTSTPSLGVNQSYSDWCQWRSQEFSMGGDFGGDPSEAIGV